MPINADVPAETTACRSCQTTLFRNFIMRLREIGWLIAVPLVVGTAMLFLCTENVFPTPHYYWALFR